jgi:hypothetical protein
MDELESDNWNKHLRPSDDAVSHLARLTLSFKEAKQLYHGQPIDRESNQPELSIAAAYDQSGQFVGIIRRDRQSWQAVKIFYQPEA